jgi:hypothetical protein
MMSAPIAPAAAWPKRMKKLANILYIPSFPSFFMLLAPQMFVGHGSRVQHFLLSLPVRSIAVPVLANRGGGDKKALFKGTTEPSRVDVNAITVQL